MGTVAGFKIAVPDPWTQAIDGLVVHLNRAARNFHILVNLAEWVYVKPLPQAQYLQTQAAHSHYHYKELILEAIGFKSVGYTSAPAAELKFSWVVKSTGVSYTELVILVTLSTKAGDQPYTFTLTAPTATFPAADSIYHIALKTFRPLPA
jgi:hypothetical protein